MFSKNNLVPQGSQEKTSRLHKILLSIFHQKIAFQLFFAVGNATLISFIGRVSQSPTSISCDKPQVKEKLVTVSLYLSIHQNTFFTAPLRSPPEHTYFIDPPIFHLITFAHHFPQLKTVILSRTHTQHHQLKSANSIQINTNFNTHSSQKLVRESAGCARPHTKTKNTIMQTERNWVYLE